MGQEVAPSAAAKTLLHAGSSARFAPKLGQGSAKGMSSNKVDLLRTASSLQQRFSIMASAATGGQRLPQGPIAAFHMPSKHLMHKRKGGESGHNPANRHTSC